MIDIATARPISDILFSWQNIWPLVQELDLQKVDKFEIEVESDAVKMI